MDCWAGALCTLPSCLPELKKMHASMGINSLYIFFGILNKNHLKFKVKKTREILKQVYYCWTFKIIIYTAQSLG